MTTDVGDDPAGGVGRGFAVRGRQGSPTVTVALPFSSVHVEANDAAVDAVAELAGLIAAIAEASARPAGAARSAELARLAAATRDVESHLTGRAADGERLN